MPSPFPGMDPFLEAHWGDMHTRLAAAISIELRNQLPDGLKARLETSVVPETEDSDRVQEEGENGSNIFFPDVGIYQHQGAEPAFAAELAGVAVAEPQLVAPRLTARKRHSVQILDGNKKLRLVTAIEIISPGNKVGARNREDYQDRVDRILDADASLVEIDLIRRGQHVVQSRPQPGQGHYAVAVTRAWKSNRIEYYPARFDFPLPTIRIPLRRKDPDATLELQKLIAQAYYDGDYGDTDYTQPLRPPFTEAESNWLQAQLKKRNQ